MPIEILDPRITRYSVGKRFSKIVWDDEFHTIRVFSRQTGQSALLGMNFIKAFVPADEQPNQNAPQSHQEAPGAQNDTQKDPVPQTEVEQATKRGPGRPPKADKQN